MEAYHEKKKKPQNDAETAKLSVSKVFIKKPTRLEAAPIDEFKPEEDNWNEEIKHLINDREAVKLINQKIRKLIPYTITYTNEKRKPNFKKSFQDDWQRVEELTILTMLYHSNSLEETKRLIH